MSDKLDPDHTPGCAKKPVSQEACESCAGYLTLKEEVRQLKEEKLAVSIYDSTAMQTENDTCPSCDALRLENVALQEKLASEVPLGHKIDFLRKKAKDTQKESKKKLRSSNTKTNSIIGKHNAEMVWASEKIAHLESRIDALHSTISERNLEAFEMERKISALKERANNAETGLRSERQQNRRLRHEKDELVQKVDHLQNSVTSVYEDDDEEICLLGSIYNLVRMIGLFFVVILSVPSTAFIVLSCAITSVIPYTDHWTQWENSAERARGRKRKAKKAGGREGEDNEPPRDSGGDKPNDAPPGRDDEKTPEDEKEPEEEKEPERQEPETEPEPEPQEVEMDPENEKIGTNLSAWYWVLLFLFLYLLVPLCKEFLVYLIYPLQTPDFVSTVPSTWYDPGQQSLLLVEVWCTASKLYSTGLQSCFEVSDPMLGLPESSLNLSITPYGAAEEGCKSEQRPEAFDQRTIINLIGLTAITIGAGYFAWKTYVGV